MEEQVYLEEILRSSDVESQPSTYAQRLWGAAKIIFLAVGLSVTAALVAIGALSVWLSVLFNT